MEIQNRSSSIFYASAVLMALFMSSHTIGVMATGNAACPLENPNFGTSYGVDGAIEDGDSYPNMLYYFGSNQGPKTWGECYRACQEWPTPGGTLCKPKNGEQGSCAYWSWTVGSGERLNFMHFASHVSLAFRVAIGSVVWLFSVPFSFVLRD
jgi:hypothetical protein